MMDSSCSNSEDIFRSSFKYYKRKNTLPDFSQVIDFRNKSPDDLQSPFGIRNVTLAEPGLPQLQCLSPVQTWKTYTLLDHPGFFFIVNPFVNGYERYWVKRCLEDYTQPPNHSNLDAIVGKSAWQNIWKSSLGAEHLNKTLLDRLHWVTLGIHHNWDTKKYSINERSVMPSDLCLLSQYVAGTLGFDRYLPEAGILNYYHIGSTLAGHTDHSEFNHEAPVISLSFGCSAIFLLGGHTRSSKPVAFFVDSGDIMVMSGQSRLSFHAIPRVMGSVERSQAFSNVTAAGPMESSCSQSNVTPCKCHAYVNDSSPAATTMCLECIGINFWDKEDEHSSIGSIKPILPLIHHSFNELLVMMNSLDCNIHEELESINWTPFEQFLSERRINLNVRQVFNDRNVDVK